MATVGNTSTPNQAWYWGGINTWNMVGYPVTMPGAGTVTAASVYFAARHGYSNCNARLVLWDGSGNVLATTGSFTISPGTGGAAGQVWHTASFTASYAAASGQNLYVGFWRDPNGTAEWSINNPNAFYITTNTTGSVGTLTGGSSYNGTPGAYLTYTPASSSTAPGGALTYDGAAWHAHPTRVYLSAADTWTRYAVKVWTGTAWVRYG